MAIGIEATFLLGTFTGHRSDGSPDPCPGLARLHAALLNAAGQGTAAVTVDAGLQPSPEAVAALEWMENHPPTGIRLPPSSRVAASPITAFRRMGVVRKEGGIWVDKLYGRPLSDGYALNGPVGWCWDQGIPDDVLTVLEQLCADVGCLGEATSPVRLAITDIEPTHTLDAKASMFDVGGVELQVPAAGRTAALTAAHASANSEFPSIAEDRPKSGDDASPSTPARQAVEPRRYRSPDTAPSSAPWPTVVLLATPHKIRPEQRVRWCTALHRALIARIGFGAPPLITGAYPKDVRQPANRLAIQYLSPALVAHHGMVSGAFALMVPGDASAAELASLNQALTGFRGFSAAGTYAKVTDVAAVRGDEFWCPPLAGHIRRWTTDPVAVPETSPQRRGHAADGSRTRWTLRDAARVSVGLVWRDVIAPQRAGNRWFEEIATRTADYGVQVHDARLLHRSDVAHWVHKTPNQILVQPYRATLSLGRLATDTTVVAIGQSRHLGGGLLVPLDSPADIFVDAAERAR
jgi:CRISPR-associated protein Csb2